ncbi:MAG: sulfotransferase family protein [Streptosporangiaceae bacterium]
MSQHLPNFLHIGPGKTGSTWLHEVLIDHPEFYFSEAKDLYFFSRYYDRGLEWYGAQFREARPENKIIGEVSPDYLAYPQAAERILTCLGPDVRLMVTLREPASRAFSAYLHLRRHGLTAPTFIQTARETPSLLDDGRYTTNLRRYLNLFDRKVLHLSVFDDLTADPQAFLDDTTEWLGAGRQIITPELLAAREPASSARWLPLATMAKHVANWGRSHDHADLVGRIRRSALVQRALYRRLGESGPVMSAEDISFVREQLNGEIEGVEQEFGIALRERWDWR